MGTITAVGGGAMRDLLLRRVPAVFGGNALYATVAVAASAVMVIASHLGSPTIGIVAAILLSLGLRSRPSDHSCSEAGSSARTPSGCSDAPAAARARAACGASTKRPTTEGLSSRGPRA